MKWLRNIFFILILSTPAFGAEALRFIGIENMPPFAYVENGVIKGYDYEVFMEVMTRAGIPVTVELLPGKRGGAYLIDGTVDGTFMIFYMKDRLKYIRYCDTPIHVSTFHLFVRKGHEFAFQSLPDLYGKRVGIQLGFTVSPEFSKAASEGKIIEDFALNMELNLKKLMADRVDCIIVSRDLVRPISETMGVANQITALPTPIISNREVLMAVSRKSKNIKDVDAFFKTFSHFRKQLDEDGTIKRIEQIYLPGKTGE